jgi:hypothetical protein
LPFSGVSWTLRKDVDSFGPARLHTRQRLRRAVLIAVGLMLIGYLAVIRTASEAASVSGLFKPAILLLAQMRSAAMSTIWSLSGEKRTSRTSRFCRCGGQTRRAAARGGGYGREAWRAVQVPRGCCEQHFVPAHNPRATLLRQKSICDNQSHHARENQQCRKGFWDHWPRRMARSR